jgi:hypothetical protein
MQCYTFHQFTEENILCRAPEIYQYHEKDKYACTLSYTLKEGFSISEP